jgi:hypothetical protein
MSYDTIYLETSDLAEYGVEIIPIFPTQNQRHALRVEFLDSVRDFPEYSDSVITHKLDSFGAFSNPSSFHCQFAKHVRSLVLDAVIKNGVFNRYLGDSAQYYQMELLFERMMYRNGYTVPPKETAHRDFTPPEHLSQGDVMFGGWLNLSEEKLSFSCKPKSHLDVLDDITVESFNNLNADAITAEFLPYKKRFRVEPGSLLVYHNNLLTEYISRNPVNQTYNMLMGWRLTTSGALLFEEQKRNAVANLAVPLLPSGKLPRMYTVRHKNAFWEKSCAVRGRKIPGEVMTTKQWIKTSFTMPVLDRLSIDNSFGDTAAMDSLTTYGYRDGYEYNQKDEAVVLSLHAIP